jgi:hypothetical protein
MQTGTQLSMFWRNMLPPHSGQKLSKVGKVADYAEVGGKKMSHR